MRKLSKIKSQENKKKSINQILYIGLALILIGTLLILYSTNNTQENIPKKKLGILIMGSVTILFGLMLSYRWITFRQKGIKYFDQLPKHETSSDITDYGKYAGWSLAASGTGSSCATNDTC